MKHIRSYQYILPGTIVFSIFLMLIGICIGDASEILPGLWKIVTMQDLLITDYIDIAGPAAAFINAGLVTITSVCILRLAKDPFNGFTIVEMGLMAGFSLFGKNMFNIWPIILGTWLYARYQREPFSKYASVALLSTSLAPLVSYMALGSVHASIPLGVLTGVAVGFLLPSLSAYTYKIQNGMNLYNMGFACGLLAMMLVPGAVAGIFTSDSALISYTTWAMRIYMAGIFAMGFQIACQQSFMALGQAKVSLLLACLRKIILLIPLIFLLPHLVAAPVFGVFLAEPVSDILAATITTITFFARFDKILDQGAARV